MSTIFRDVIIGPPEKASELGIGLAKRLLDEGAGEFIKVLTLFPICATIWFNGGES